MAEETNDNVEETTQAQEAGAPEAQAPDAEVTEAQAPEAEATPQAAEPVQETAQAPAVHSGPAEVLAPKERRRRHRAAKADKVKRREPRTPEQRHEERQAERRAKAQLRRSGRGKARAKASHTGAEATPPREHVPGVQKVRQGVVVSDKADKTITVRIDTARRHRRYEKIVRTSRTLHAHDERNDAHTGDTVVVREARPLSRTKRWRLVEVIERAK
jgi:small subunit ribosomal protein S17